MTGTTSAAAGGAAARPAVSPLAPAGGFPALPVIAGAEFAAAAAGIKYRGRDDVMLVRLAPGTVIAGAFTRSATRSAPVRDCEAKLAAGEGARGGAAIIVNSGNANAFTGRLGEEAVAAVTQAVAAALDIPAGRVFPASTGVIGEPLAHGKIAAAMPALAGALSGGGIGAAARAIMTTDTFAKGATAAVAGEGGAIRIAGIAKGSGMIAPDMATMLVYVFTDAKVSQPALQAMVDRGLRDSFNAITVDGDTSTSDTLIVAATGRSPAREVAGPVAEAFEAALHGVMRDLALQVVRDGEGATKLVEIRVSGASSDEDAARVAFTVANSPLVKTAIAGEDPNWGRVIAAIGRAGARAERDRITLRFGDILVAEGGWKALSYSEEAGASYMKGQELVIGIDLGLGEGRRSVWTCDLTARYVEINADYRS